MYTDDQRLAAKQEAMVEAEYAEHEMHTSFEEACWLCERDKVEAEHEEHETPNMEACVFCREEAASMSALYMPRYTYSKSELQEAADIRPEMRR